MSVLKLYIKMLIIAISTTHKQCSGTGIIIQLTLEFELPSPVLVAPSGQSSKNILIPVMILVTELEHPYSVRTWVDQ